MQALTVAALQLTSTEDVASNLARCAALAAAAADAGATLIGLPENFAYLGTDRDHRLALAEPLPEAGDDLKTQSGGPILTAMQELARRTGAWLLLGGFPERASSPAHIRNTSVLLRADGTLAAIYRKIHLFDVDVPGGKRFRESETVEPGEDLVVAETPWGPSGLHDLLRPALPGAVPRADGAGRAPVGGAVGVHARDGQGSLERAAARARHREPGLRLRARAVWSPRRQPAQPGGTP